MSTLGREGTFFYEFQYAESSFFLSGNMKRA